MQRRFLLIPILFSFFLVSCGSVLKTRRAESSLDRAIKYTEITSTGRDIPLSKINNREACVPYGAEVDINSTIRVEIDTGSIQVLDGYQPDNLTKRYPTIRAHNISNTLVQLQKVINSRLKALNAYQKTRGIPFSEMDSSLPYKEFVEAVSEYGKLRSEFNTLPIWEDGTFTEDEVAAAF